MFDFGADGRSEGGENGVNHKGFVTFDRKIKKVAEPNPDYMLEEQSLTNWFDTIEVREGYFSIKDTLKELKEVDESRLILEEFQEYAVSTRGDVAKGVKMSKEMIMEINEKLNKVRKV